MASDAKEKYRLGCKRMCPIYLEMGTVRIKAPKTPTHLLVSEIRPWELHDTKGSQIK